MRIITNADDFGLDDDTTRATIDCFGAGALTSASIMPKMPATAQAVAFARAHGEFSFGVHLTFVCDTVESPLAPRDQVGALVASDGRFLGSQRVRKLALLNRIPIAQIAAEIAAQIAFLRDSGVRISHVDSHGHLHKFKPFRVALREVLPRFGLTKVRSVQTIYLKKPLKSPTFWCGPVWRRRLRALFTTTPDFFMPTPADTDTWPERLLATVAPGTTIEVGVHPGYQESWRVLDRQAVLAFAAAARARGHRFITWNDV